MCQNQQNQFFFLKEKENLFFWGSKTTKHEQQPKKFLGGFGTVPVQVMVHSIEDYFFFFLGHGQLDFQCFLEAGKWNRSSFWTWASGISVLFGRRAVQSQLLLGTCQQNLSSVWTQRSGISVPFGHRKGESQFFLDAGTWNRSSFETQARGILAGTQVSCSCQQAADWISQTDFGVFLEGFSKMFFPMNSFFHFIQFQFKMKK